MPLLQKYWFLPIMFVHDVRGGYLDYGSRGFTFLSMAHIFASLQIEVVRSFNIKVGMKQVYH